MSLSNYEVAAILRLRDDLARAMGANQGQITAALKAADQMRDIVNSPALRQMQEMYGRDLLYLRELRDASEQIKSQFGMAQVKAVADAFVGLKVFDSEQTFLPSGSRMSILTSRSPTQQRSRSGHVYQTMTSITTIQRQPQGLSLSCLKTDTV